jgi:small subunit ribosomal protein S2
MAEKAKNKKSILKQKKRKTQSGYDVPLEELLEAGCHFGHQTKRWHPLMKKYIWTERDKVHIFDLPQTQVALIKAAKLIEKVVSEGKQVLLVGTKRQASEVILSVGEKVKMPFADQRWLGGTLTNWKQIKKTVDRLMELQEQKKTGGFTGYTKKERSQFDKEIIRLNRIAGGLKGMKGLPGAVFVVDVKRESVVVREANRVGIPVVAIVDSNCDPRGVKIVIPANDDALRSIKLIVELIGRAIKNGSK